MVLGYLDDMIFASENVAHWWDKVKSLTASLLLDSSGRQQKVV